LWVGFKNPLMKKLSPFSLRRERREVNVVIAANQQYTAKPQSAIYYIAIV
jgi:hypothetical protein